MKNDDHPCFSCHLPDCDDESYRCPLRRATRFFQSATRRGDPISDELRRARNIAYAELYRPGQYVSHADRKSRTL